MHNRLAQYTEEALLRHECVTLPSIGGFILEHCPAAWDKDRHIVYAPHVEVRFNEALTHHDGILIEQYALGEGISLRRAKLELEQDIQGLKQELLRAHRYRISGVGVLALSSNGRLEFTPNPSPMIQHAYYGLGAIMTPLRQGLSASEQKKTDVDYIQIRIPRKAARYTVAASVLAVLIGLPLAMWQPTKDTFSASVAPSPREVSRVVERVRTEVKQIQQETPREEQQESVWISPEAEHYYLIIGTEKHRSNAEGYIKLYQERFPKLRILEGKKLYRISAETFTSREQAQAQQRALAKDGISSWIYVP